MKVTMMGEIRPENSREIREAVEGLISQGVDVSSCEVEICYEPFDPSAANEQGINMTGYVAEVRDMDNGNSLLMTHGFEDKKALLLAFQDQGMTEFNDITGE